MTLHGLVQFDSRTFFDPNPYTQGEDGFLLRRARPILAATMFRDYDFLLVPDFGGSSVQLFDASVNCRFAPWLQLKAGKFKGPVGLEQLQTDAACFRSCADEGCRHPVGGRCGAGQKPADVGGGSL
jgi:phosphate-selective porin OprO/OprP